jgi:16S rRNA (cytidine1402-2'-O)-methyltransferase
MPDAGGARSGTLYLIPTPLGNLADLTLRAIDVLKQVDLVACEDTRRTLGLLNHLGISKPLWSYHAHSPRRRPAQLLNALESGKSVGLVCDAGTPGISDPGVFLVQAALASAVPVVSLPGPCAAITALVASGLPTDRFFFIGFLPRRSARARRALAGAAASGATTVVYESPFRTLDTLEMIDAVAGPDTPAVVARELTKIHEEYIRGTVREIREKLHGKPILGEVIILFQAAAKD